MKGKKIKILWDTKRGFTLIQMLVVVAIIGVLVTVAIPSLVKSRESTQTKACIENIRNIWFAQQQWAQAHETQVTKDLVAADLLPYLGDSALPKCPSGGTYVITKADTMPYCDVPAHKTAAASAGYQ